MSKKIFSKEKEIASVECSKLYYVDILKDSIPVAFIYDKGKTEYSPDSRYILYNNEYLGPIDNVESLTLSNDEKQAIFKVEIDSRYYLYLNNKKIAGPFDYIEGIIFAEKSAKYAYVGTKDNVSYVYIENQKKYGPFDYVSELMFFDNDTLYFFANKENKWDFYIEGKAQNKTFEKLTFFTSLDKDRTKAVYCMKKQKEWFMGFLNGKVIGPFDNIGFQMRISKKLRKFACVVQKGKDSSLYVDGEKMSKAFKFIDFIQFFPDEKDVIYSVKDENGSYIYVNKQMILGPFEKIGFEISFSKDCKTIYYAVKENNKWTIGHTHLDDPEYKYIKDIDVPISCYEVFHLVFSEDINTIFYSTNDGNNFLAENKSFVFLGNEKPLGPFFIIENMICSKDGSILAFIIIEADGRYIYINGKKIAGPFLNLGALEIIDDFNILKFFAVKNREEDDLEQYIYFQENLYIGSFSGDSLIYFKNGKIMIRKAIKE